jgi:hypothetical protein
MLIVLGVLVVVAVACRGSPLNEGSAAREGHPQGYGVGVGIALGAGLGVALGTIVDDIAIGIPIGVALGAAIGAAWERSHASELRPLTDSENRLRRRGVTVGLALALMGLLVFVALWLFLVR